MSTNVQSVDSIVTHVKPSFFLLFHPFFEGLEPPYFSIGCFWGLKVVFVWFLCGWHELIEQSQTLAFYIPPKIIGKNIEKIWMVLTNKHLLQLVVAGSRYYRYFFYVVRLQEENSKTSRIVHLETWVFLVIQFSPGKTDENKEVDSQIACCNKQEICDMCAECTINTIESHERPKSPQALNSSHQLCSICFFDLSIQLCCCVAPWLPWLQVILQVMSWTRRWKSMQPKSSTPWVVWMQRVTQKKQRKFRPGDLHPWKWTWNTIITEIWFRWCSFLNWWCSGSFSPFIFAGVFQQVFFRGGGSDTIHLHSQASDV